MGTRELSLAVVDDAGEDAERLAGGSKLMARLAATAATARLLRHAKAMVAGVALCACVEGALYASDGSAGASHRRSATCPSSRIHTVCVLCCCDALLCCRHGVCAGPQLAAMTSPVRTSMR